MITYNDHMIIQIHQQQKLRIFQQFENGIRICFQCKRTISCYSSCSQVTREPDVPQEHLIHKMNNNNTYSKSNEK